MGSTTENTSVVVVKLSSLISSLTVLPARLWLRSITSMSAALVLSHLHSIQESELAVVGVQ